MPLDIKLSLVEINKFATGITLKDETGAYNVSTNPGGYGTDNDLESPATTGAAFILWRYWTDETFTTKKLNGQQITDIQAAGLEVSTTILGLTSEDGKFSDGVHQIKYLPGQALSGVMATYTNGSKIVTLTGATTIPDLLASGALVWISANINVGFYEIDTTGTNNNSQLTLKTAFAETTNTDGITVAAEADLKVLVNKSSENCIVSAIGQLEEVDGDCSEVEKTLNKLIRWKFAADIKKADADYDGAHNLLVSISKICNSGKCICSL